MCQVTETISYSEKWFRMIEEEESASNVIGTILYARNDKKKFIPLNKKQKQTKTHDEITFLKFY